MIKGKKILVIIPARWGSKWIPKKNLKLLNWRPLISYVINEVKKVKEVDEVIVSSDDELILSIVKEYGVNISYRNPNLSQDSTTIDEVIYDFVKKNPFYDIVVTIQPTSPLISSDTIKKAILKFIESNKNTLLSVEDATHLYWMEDKETWLYKLIVSERKNRQYLPKIYKETWGIIISRKDYILSTWSRVDPNSIILFEVPKEEAIDIDDYFDLQIAASILNYRYQWKIWINVIGNSLIGMWHIYRQLEIAFLLNVKPIFFVRKWNDLAEMKIKDSFYPVIAYENDKEFIEYLNKFNISVLINDILDTTEDFILNIRKSTLVKKIINFEDMGTGRKHADVVINDLYNFISPYKNEYYWWQYAILRHDVLFKEKNQFNSKCENIVITCGGTDPNNLTLIYLNFLKELQFKGNVKIILWLWYSIDKEKQLIKFIDTVPFNVEIKKDISNMWKELSNIDLALTSNGRTIYEIAHLNIPYVSIAQNDREMLHTFAIHSWWGRFLGRYDTLDFKKSLLILEKIISYNNIRKKYYDNLLTYDFKDNINRVLNLILDH